MEVIIQEMPIIPKIIHYCWFGRGRKPRQVRRCIKSWHRYMPDFEVKEWNETNFDVERFPYAKEAYQHKKYAFVSDVARMWILHNFGGVYLDTDVRALGSLEPFLKNIAFTGFETDDTVGSGIIGSVKGGEFVSDNLEYYVGRHFINKQGMMDLQANVRPITDLLEKKGLKRNNSLQNIRNYLIVYPKEYFCPMNFDDCTIRSDERTVTVHYFASSWKPEVIRRNRKIHIFFGDKIYSFCSGVKNSIAGVVKNHILHQ